MSSVSILIYLALSIYATIFTYKALDKLRKSIKEKEYQKNTFEIRMKGKDEKKFDYIIDDN